MEAAGIQVSVFGLAQMYADVCSKLVIDIKDGRREKGLQPQTKESIKLLLENTNN